MPATYGLISDCELPHKPQRQKEKLDHSYDLHCSYNKDKFLRSNANGSFYEYLTNLLQENEPKEYYKCGSKFIFRKTSFDYIPVHKLILETSKFYNFDTNYFRLEKI